MPTALAAPIVKQASVTSKLRAVAYYRHSAEDRREQSIATQRDRVREWADENGVEIIHEFTDAGKSGLNAEDRPAFNELMDDWVTCKTENYIRDYVRLVEQGEDRLIQGVEQGVFPIKFATQVASTDDGQLQNVLMDAFDAGLVTTTNFAQARQIMSARARDSKSRKSATQYTVTQLRQDIEDATRVRTSYVREARTKENRFMALLSGINALWQDAAFVKLLGEENLCDRPDLAGEFRYEP